MEPMTAFTAPIEGSAWVGLEMRSHDELRFAWMSALEATLDLVEDLLKEWDPLAPGWHWTFFHSIAPLSALGTAGHARPGDFLPAIDQARCMWAGGRLTIRAPIRTGEQMACHSTIYSVNEKNGASGQLRFVTVRHHLTPASGGDVLEDHDIVYLAMAGSTTFMRQSAPLPTACHDPEITLSVTPPALQLFCYSALTFKSHRIYYGADYARSQEGYSGVIVHGPLLATFPLQRLRKRCSARVSREFTYRAHNPLILGRSCSLMRAPRVNAAVCGPGDRRVMRS